MHFFTEQREKKTLKHKKRPLQRWQSSLYFSFVLAMFIGSGALIAQDLPGFFKTATGVTDDGATLYTFQLTQSAPEYPAQAPLDSEHLPSCQELIDTLSATLPVQDGSVQYQCTQSTAPRQGTTITMSQKEDIWKIKTLDWYNGWMTLHADFDDSESFSRSQLTRFWHMCDNLTTSGQKNSPNQPLPVATWQWLADHYKALANGVLASWHSYEILSHSLHLIHGVQAKEWGGLVLSTLSTLFHALEGMEHAHYAGLGRYVHTDFHGDIIEASSYPHATNIGLASAALSLNIIELLYPHYGHNHGHEHGHSRLHTLLDTLHTGLHVYELGDALNNWWHGRPAHEHIHHEHIHHEHDKSIRLPASDRGQK